MAGKRPRISLCLCLNLAPFLFPTSVAQVLQFGRCPRLAGIPNFDVAAYTGLWYEIEKYFFVFESTTSCVRVTYFDSRSEDGSYAVEILQYDHVTKRTFNNPGLTRYKSHDGSGNFDLDVLITQSPVPFTVTWPYLVLGIDYETYTIKWSCQDLGPFNIQNMWILSRIMAPFPRQVKAEIDAILLSKGLSPVHLKRSDLRQCPTT